MWKSLLLYATAVFVACTSLTASSWAACQTDDIKIRQADWHRLSGTDVKIVGEFFNGCAEPTGVQLAFTFRDPGGLVVDVREMWPASTRNIEPKTAYPFELVVDVGLPASSMTARVLEVRQWEM
jgi:hypothetical protein